MITMLVRRRDAIGSSAWVCLFAAWPMVLVLFAIGCGGSVGSPNSTSNAFGGGVHSGIDGVGQGEIPISSATVTVYEVGTTGYGSLPTSLGQTTTNNQGNYTFENFSCPSPDTLVYLVAVGGNLPGSQANNYSALMTVIGACGNLGPANSFSSIDVDELTTVASVYAVNRFMNPQNPSQIGAPTGNSVGLANAAAAVTNLANFSNGAAITLLPHGFSSPNVLGSLANILASCVTDGSGCPTELLSYVNAPPSSPATNTLMAAFDIATNPTYNVAKLFDLQSQLSSPSYPGLDQAPAAWTLSIYFDGFDGPIQIAIDAAGNAWVTNSSNSSLSKVSPQGSQISNFTGGGLTQPYGLAIDASGNVWVANNQDSISEFDSSGNPNSNSPFHNGGLDHPKGIAIAGSGHLWIANNSGNSLSELDSSGNSISGSPFTGGGLGQPFAIAIDGAGNVWTGNLGFDSLSKFNSSGTAISPDPRGYPFGGINGPFSIAVDDSGNVWVANEHGLTVSEIDSSGDPHLNSPFSGGGLNQPYGVAIDSAGDIWTANFAGNSISELNPQGQPISPDSSGYPGLGLDQPTGLAIDASGNIWVVNNGYRGSITEFIGAASPVLTPLGACLNRSGQPVCLP